MLINNIFKKIYPYEYFIVDKENDRTIKIFKVII